MYVIADRWYVALTSEEVPAERPVGVRRLGHDLVLWRNRDGRACAAIDVCPHRGVKLSGGRVVDGHLACPFHGFRFDDNGACTAIPAHPDRPIPKAMRLGAVSVHEAHGFVWIWSGAGAPGAPPSFFDFNGFSAAGSTFPVDVDCHYSRGIENQLDFAHLAFVHDKSIGRGLDPAVQLHVRTEGDAIIAHMDGMGADALEFRGPGIWRLKTGPAWQFLAFVPIDDDRMRVYVRTYQPWVTGGPLAWLIGVLGRVPNRWVFREDVRVVETHARGEVRLRMGEVLLPSDAAIIAYRRWREERRTPTPFEVPKAGTASGDPVPA